MLAAEVLERIPTDPGVYLFKDAGGKVIYVGKAKSLRARVRQYFRGGDERFVVAAGYLTRAIADVETIVVTVEKEALLLENHLIKKHQPKFNVKLRDDKQYLVLRVAKPANPGTTDATKAALFPRVQVVRNIRDDDAAYFGPYHSATSARQTLRVLNRHFQLRTCTDHVLENRVRPCLQYQIKRCPGPCVVDIDPASYAEQVDDVTMFLAGRDQELVARLKTRMQARAEEEAYEAAAAIRDSIAAVQKTLERQDMVQDDFVDQDVWGLYRQADSVEVAVLFIRNGKLVGRRTFSQKHQELPDADVIAEHVQQYYDSGTLVPAEIVVGVLLESPNALAEWLASLRGRKVKVSMPQRGQRARLVDLADKNAAAAATSKRSRDDDAEEILAKLQTRLGLPRLPRRIECFDIAHMQGSQTVASMVTFVDGVPAKALYRKFKVRSVANDDFASMFEVLARRFRRAKTQAAAAPGAPASDTADTADTADQAANVAWQAPDLLVIDGGKGQLGMAVAALGDCGVAIGGDGPEVISLAKERELGGGEAPDRVYLRNQKDAIALRPNTPELYLLARLRDEAHRFANSFHQQRRGKAAIASELDTVPGVGPTRKKQLLKYFGSVRAIREASLDQLRAAPGVTLAVADALYRTLHPSDD